MRLLSLTVKCYRTLEDVTLQFPNYYTAICGKNNSGKSNIIRVIRSLFGEEERFPFRDDVTISHKADLTAWKREDSGTKDIAFTANVELNRAADRGLVEFIERIAKSETNPLPIADQDIFTLSLHSTLKSDKTSPDTSVHIGSHVLDDVASREIFKKLRSASTVVYHNSTQTQFVYFSKRRRVHGMLSRLDDNSKQRLHSRSQSLKKEVDKILETHRTELATLIGKLDERIEVKLSAPEFDVDECPFEISLGYRGYDVSLDDWGSGTRKQTLILNSIFEAKKAAESPSVSDHITPLVLIEEPESFLHPLAQAHFGNVLQDLTDELKIQVIATTHSPYLLSHRNPTANILLARTRRGRSSSPGPSSVIPVNDTDWKEPFEHALGIVGPEFEAFKAAVFSRSSVLILVEGDTDKAYFELCRAPEHGDNALTSVGELLPYGGWSALTNTLLMRFIRDRFSKVIVTGDLDAEKNVSKHLENLGFKKGVTYFPVGIDAAGKRSIEGLLPESILQQVHVENPSLVNALTSNLDEERKKSHRALKNKYLEKFKARASIQNGDFGQLYALCRSITKAIHKQPELS